MKRPTKSTDGMYHINGKKYSILIGSRAQVEHETAYKTPGGLKKANLIMNKHGHIVSRKKHLTAKKEKRLEKYGFFTKKGKFGFVKGTKGKSKSRKGSRK